MKPDIKKSVLFLPLCLLLTSLLAACGTTTYVFDQQPVGDSVGACGASFQPVLTTMRPSSASAQSVYFISGVHLYALNAGNGTLHWCIHANNLYSNPAIAQRGDILPVVFGPPPRPDGFSGLTVNNGVVYAGSMDNYTYAFNAHSGALLWHQQTGAVNASTPTAVRDTVYVSSDTIYALNAQNGAIRWKYPTHDVVTSSPVSINGLIYAGSYDGNIYALDATNGTKRWSYQTGGRIYVPPIVDHNVVYFGSGDNAITLFALNAQTGKLLWSQSTSVNADSSLSVANGILYAGSNSALFALNAQTGTLLWRSPIATPLHPLVANGILYVTSETGLFALNPQNGALLWQNALDETQSMYISRPVILENKIYVEALDMSTSPSKVMLHALNVNNGGEDWYTSVAWNISTVGVAV